jgi:hypothetical protein
LGSVAEIRGDAAGFGVGLAALCDFAARARLVVGSLRRGRD